MKNLTIRAIGKLSELWQRDAVHIYEERLSSFSSIEIIELPEGHKSSAKPDEAKTRSTEADSLLKNIPDEAFVVALDETGKAFSSLDLAKKIESWSDQGRRPLVFMIGGSWGLDQRVRDRANFTLSFGPMTLPHGIARILLAEQLYRAKMISSGKTYHK
jgi:23S rRNA (pseudouridine1915-N3)-methyltransferase